MFARLLSWWRDLRGAVEEPFDIDFPGDSGYCDSNPPIPDGFDLRAMRPPLSFLDTFPGEQEGDK